MVSKEILERTAADIQKYGWHVIMINCEKPAIGFCFTIGLTESYGHPELLLYATGPEVGGMASYLEPIVARISAGARFHDGDKLPEAFKQHTGAFRKVLDCYHSIVLGTALAYYAEKPFEVLQLYWPDVSGFFPWDSGFSDGMAAVPCLFESNLLLACLDPESACHLLDQQGQGIMETSLGELLRVPSGEGVMAIWETLESRLPPQRSGIFGLFKKKKKGILGRITLMGDPVVWEADGTISLLSARLGRKVLLAKSDNDLPLALLTNFDALFPRSLLLHARELGFWPGEGEVFSLRLDPSQGGAFHVDNLDRVSAAVHLAFLEERISKGQFG